MSGLQQVYLGNIYTPQHNALLDRVLPLLKPAFPALATRFYDELTRDENARHFISSELVERRLRQELQDWLTMTLSPHAPEEVADIVALQRHVGHVHARIDIPMALVDASMLILKQGCFMHLLNVMPHDRDLYEAFMLVNSLLEASLSIINEAYLDALVDNERNAQALRGNISGQEIAFEIERVRTQLFSWLSEAMMVIMAGDHLDPYSLQRSDFGLWIVHKLDMVSPDKALVDKIRGLLDQVYQHLSQRQPEGREQGPIAETGAQRRALCEELNHIVSEAAWLLADIAEAIVASWSKEDSLTHLIDRRFLGPVLQKETQHALAMTDHPPYSLLLLDVDHFKSVNDRFGHQAGDRVLSAVANTIRHAVRVSDYCFRYGGEEFLILLPECPGDKAEKVAEKLRLALAEQNIMVDDQRIIRVTASIGVSQFVGHPDYLETVKVADAALYEAKHGGRNLVIRKGP